MEFAFPKRTGQSAQRGGSISSQRRHAQAASAVEFGQLIDATHAAKQAIITGCRQRDTASLLVTLSWRPFQLPEASPPMKSTLALIHNGGVIDRITARPVPMWMRWCGSEPAVGRSSTWRN